MKRRGKVANFKNPAVAWSEAVARRRRLGGGGGGGGAGGNPRSGAVECSIHQAPTPVTRQNESPRKKNAIFPRTTSAAAIHGTPPCLKLLRPLIKKLSYDLFSTRDIMSFRDCLCIYMLFCFN